MSHHARSCRSFQRLGATEQQHAGHRCGAVTVLTPGVGGRAQCGVSLAHFPCELGCRAGVGGAVDLHITSGRRGVGQLGCRG